MNGLALTIDDARFAEALNNLSDFIGDSGKVVQIEGRALLKEVFRQTPPPNQLQGREKVKSDLRKVFMPLDSTDFSAAKRAHKAKLRAAKRIRKNVEDDNLRELWVTRGGVVFYTDAANFKPDASIEELKKIHQSKRNQYGRVSGVGQRVVKRSPKEAYINRVAIKRSLFNKYQRQVLQKVGTMRSGFAPALQKLSVSVPGWVSRAFKTSHGAAVANFSGPNAFIEFKNTTPGVVREVGRAFKTAMENRAHKMAVNLRRMIKYGPGKSGDYGYGRT